MNHVTITVMDKYSGNAISVVDSYVSDIYSSMVEHGIMVINSFSGKSVRNYSPWSDSDLIVEKAWIIHGTTDDVSGIAKVMGDLSSAPILISVSSYED